MSKELIVSSTTLTTVYAVGRVAKGDNVGQWGNLTSGNLEGYDRLKWANYAITLTELEGSGLFEGDMPAVFNGERFVDIIFLTRGGAAPLPGDTKLDGSALYELSDEWVPTNAINV